MEEKRKKVLKTQMPLWDRKKAVLYFRDMAAEGKILDEVGYLHYYFRADAPPLFPQEENKLAQLERQIQETEEQRVRPDVWMLFIILLSFGIAVYRNGFQRETLLAAAFCIGFYYLADLNEKTFLLTEEVFAERPILRAEQLAEGDWESVGEGVDLSREGLHPPKKIEYGVDSYRVKKKQGKLHNYGMEYRNLPILEEKLYATQSLRERETGKQAELRMTYCRYRAEGFAERRFEEGIRKIKNGAGIYSGEEIPWANAERKQINLSHGKFDRLCVYLASAEAGERLEVVAWRGNQVMEITYRGTADAE